MVATLSVLALAQSGAPQPNTAAGRAGTEQSMSDTGRGESAKSPASAGGRVDGYLASGRWREGSKLIDMAGKFKTSGERVAFHSADGKLRFPCLENLNSERVARIVAESPPESLDWIVQGTLTEFRNENYLLLTQAVISSRTTPGPRPVRERPLPVKEAPATTSQR
jgi:hypothetical protein